ncbi:MAG: Chitinase [Patescibacteria group bacterium]|nr:Chitinase [Patescibacteria group bacterium]
MGYSVRWLVGLLIGIIVWAGAVSGGPVVLAAETKPPTVPGNFQAVVAEGSTTLTLSWQASTDESGIAGYRLDRSLDQLTWVTLSDSIPNINYEDKTAGFGVHYYYRLLAIDRAGNASAWAATDLETSTFHSGQTSTGDAYGFASSDSLASVVIPKDAVRGDSSMDCVLSTAVPSTKQVGTSAMPLVLGPYALTCRTIAGTPILAFEKPITWRFDVSGKLKGLISPKAYKFDSDGRTAPLATSRYNTGGQVVTVQMVTTDPIVVLAEKPKNVISANFIVFLMVIGLLVWGLIVLMIHRKRKNDHEAYLRSKYYNL